MMKCKFLNGPLLYCLASVVLAGMVMLAMNPKAAPTGAGPAEEPLKLLFTHSAPQKPWVNEATALFNRTNSIDDLEVGETVIVIGCPYGYINTVTTGIVSALNRQIAMPTGDTLQGLIQIDAAVNPGNSGGPLLNINGEMIGVVCALRAGADGIAFAINADTVRIFCPSTFARLRNEHRFFSMGRRSVRIIVCVLLGELRTLRTHSLCCVRAAFVAS